MTRQFAPGDPLLIRATATDVTAAQLSRGENAWLRVGPGDVVEASGAVTEAGIVQILCDVLGPPVDVQLPLYRDLSERIAAALARPAHAPRVPEELKGLLEHLPKGFLKLEIDEVGEGPNRRPIAFVVSEDEQYLLVDESPPCVDEPPAPYAQAAIDCINFVRTLIANQPAAPVVANEGAE